MVYEERLVSAMNGTEKTDILLAKLKEDSLEYKELETIGYSLEEKKNVIRSLMNIRMPRVISDELADLQNEYLQEELKTKGVVSLADIQTIKEQFGSKSSYAEILSLWQGDITRLKVGAIVNAANSQMLGCFVPCHRCIDNAIHSAAGMQLREECSHIMSRRRLKYGRNYEEPTGTATLTKAYNLPCDYVIHTVGPIVYDGLNDMLCQDLRNCYENVHVPNDKAAEIAVDTVTGFLEKHDNCIERVIFNVFKDNDLKLYERLFQSCGM